MISAVYTINIHTLNNIDELLVSAIDLAKYYDRSGYVQICYKNIYIDVTPVSTLEDLKKLLFAIE